MNTLRVALSLITLSCSAALAEEHEGPFRPSSIVRPGPDTEGDTSDRSASYITAFSQLRAADENARGVLGIMPGIGELNVDPQGYRSGFRPSEGEAEPGYFSVLLEDHKIRAEITAINRVALYRFTFPESKESHVLVDISHTLDLFSGGEVYLRDDKTIEGTAKYAIGPGPAVDVAFSIQFSKPFRRRGMWKNDKVMDGKNRASADEPSPLGAFVFFYTHEGETILVKIGISEIDIADARRNLQREFPGWDFNQVRRESVRAWDQ